LHPRYRHLANTAATVARPDTWNNMVRPGLALYGYNLTCEGQREGPGAETTALPVRPVLTWKTRIIALRDIAPGTAVGYNQRWRAARPTRLAVIPVGYGDGFNRQLSKGGKVILDDHYAPIVGNISMDLTTIDVTDIPEAAIGDEVLLIGRSEHCSVGADDQARLAGTIVYEILCGLSPRVPRVYLE
jgi:alanine racemase